MVRRTAIAVDATVLIMNFVHELPTGHYVENIGNTTLRYLEIWNTGKDPGD